jgi:hypothetical protein
VTDLWASAADCWLASPVDDPQGRAWLAWLCRCSRRDLPEVASLSDIALRSLVRRYGWPTTASMPPPGTWLDLGVGVDVDACLAEIEAAVVQAVRDHPAASWC